MRSPKSILLMAAAALLSQAPARGDAPPAAPADPRPRAAIAETRPAATGPADTRPAETGDDDTGDMAEPGAVQKALVRLYRIPLPPRRDREARAAASRPAGESAAGMAGTAAEVPRPPTPVEADLAGRPDTAVDSAGGEALFPPNGGGDAGFSDLGPGFYQPGGSGLTACERRWADYRYFGGQPSRYGYDREYYSRFGRHGDGGEAYRFGFLRGYDRGRFEARADERGKVLRALSGRRLQEGLQRFRSGDYRGAAAAFKLAAESNQGDPAAAIYAAHALFAIGRYRDAAGCLRHAFNMQPKIALLDYDIRDDYGSPEDFQSHLAALEQASRDDPRNTDRLLVLAYVYSFSGQRERAATCLRQARRLGCGDRLIEHLEAGQLLPDVPPGPAATRPARSR